MFGVPRPMVADAHTVLPGPWRWRSVTSRSSAGAATRRRPRPDSVSGGRKAGPAPRAGAGALPCPAGSGRAGRHETWRPARSWDREAGGAGVGGRWNGAYAFGPMPAVSVPASFCGSAGSLVETAPVAVAIDGVSTEA